MIARRSLLAAAVATAATAPVFRLAAASDAAPSAVISQFYGTLLTAMKRGPDLGFKGRAEILAPAIRRAFDLPLMTRLTIGPQWAELSAGEQQQLETAFSEFSIATYANRFNDYSGERFDVDPQVGATPNGVIVHSKLIQNDGTPVQLDYLMHKTAIGWQIVDVYLSGTVSELATRRSEFTSILRRGGAGALVEALQKKVAQLGS